MDEIQPRFEFRIWGQAVDEAAGRLRALAMGEAGTAQTSETYLVARGRVDVNAKIRNGVLDIKILHQVVHGCEQWSPWTKAEFPLASTLIEAVFPRLGVPLPRLEHGMYDYSQFIDDVVAPEPLLLAVRVDKTRERLAVGPSLGDIADVAVDGMRMQTLAIESTDLEALVALREQLGLCAVANVNYPAAIKEALGLTLDEVS